MGHVHVHHHLLLLLLPSWTLQQCRTNGHCSHPGFRILPVHLDVPALHLHFCPHDDCWYSRRRVGRKHWQLAVLAVGDLQQPEALPGFWIFMYRVSPYTYLVEGMLSTGIANQDTTCAENEFVTLQPPGGQTCEAYMQRYISL